MNDDLLRPQALYEGVAESLRARLFAHEFAPGAALDEAKLAHGYGVSRTPVREALKVLAREGLLVIEPRRGCCVAAFCADDVARLFDVLELLEIYLVREVGHQQIRPDSSAFDYSRLIDWGRNRHAGEAINRLREKLLLALGPAYGQEERALFGHIAPALAAALLKRDQNEAERVWWRYAMTRRGLAGCGAAPHTAPS